jgi:hypothetical protein
MIIDYNNNIKFIKQYKDIILDFISKRIYDCLINYKPNNDGKLLFHKFIKDDLNLLFEK